MDVTKGRNKFIGGSDVAAILGLNKYKTAYEVWEEKKHNIKTFSGNAATEWGQLLEPVILDKYEKDTGLKIENRNDRFIHPNYEFLGCHPDGISGQILFEVKTVSSKAYWNWKQEVPLEYYCQIQHNLFITGLLKAKFLIFVLDDRNLIELDVNFDYDFVKQQNEYLINWWNNYIIGENIPIKTSTVYEKETELEEQIVEASEKALKTYNELSKLKAELKILTEKKELLEEILKTEIGSGTILMNGLNQLATWKPQKQVRIDAIKIKEEQPDIYVKYAKEISFRKFLIKL